MASLYKNGNYYYISINFEGKRTVKSLGTKDKKVAKALKPYVETSILQELTGFKESSLDLSFSELVSHFLKASHPWAPATYEMNRYILTAHLDGKHLPTNATSRAIHIRHINQCWNWGLKNKLVKKAHIIPGDTKGESRDRVYTECELNLMFTSIKDDSFNSFVRFAYYTGARSGEIRSISRDCILDDSLVVHGKSGRRIIKFLHQQPTPEACNMPYSLHYYAYVQLGLTHF